MGTYELFVIYRCLYGEDFIDPSIRSILNYADKVFVFWTDKVWGNATSVMYKGRQIYFPQDGKFDRIRDRLSDVESKYPGRVIVKYDHVVNNQNQFTHLVNDLILPYWSMPRRIMMMEVDYVWREDQIEMALAEFDALGAQHATTSQVELWKTFGYQVMRNDPNRKAAMIWDTSNLAQIPPTNRHFDAKDMIKLSASVHNLGFCASAQVIYWKHLTALGYCKKIGDSAPNEDWFDKVWQTWDYETNNSNLEMSKGYEHLIPSAVPYTDRLPEVLKGVICPS